PEDERPEVFMKAFQTVASMVKQVVRQAEKTLDDVDLFVTVQPLRFIIDELRRRVNIPPPRVHDCFHKYGSVPGAVIPIPLADAMEAGLLKRGAFVALGAFNNAGETVTALSA